MPQSSEQTKEAKTPATTKTKKNYFEIRVPKFTFENTRMNAFLVVSLIIFAFLLGMLTNKVLFLQEQNKLLQAGPTAAAGETAIPTPPAVVEDLGVGKLPILGNKEAKVTVVEFSDLQCPFCKKYFDDTHAQLKEAYVDTGKIAFAYRHYPLSSIHPLAQKAGEASECANEQNNFWGYHDLLFNNQDTWSPPTPLTEAEAFDSFVDYADQLGMNTVQFRSCLESDKYKANVDADTAVGNDVQVDGTPTFFINGRRVVGAVPFADLQKVIDEELNK